MSSENLHDDMGSSAEELNLLDYWLLIRSNYRKILSLAFIVSLLAALVVFQMTPVYRSTALLLIENAKGKVLTLNDLYEGQRDSSEAFNSQVQILKSRPVAENVIRKLKLTERAAFIPEKASGWFAKEPVGTKEEQVERLHEAILQKFERDLTVEPVLKSQIVKISFDSTDKVLAAEVANAVVDAYVDNDLEARSQMTQKANVWLTERMTGLRAKLEFSEQALQRYREQENIIDNKGVVLSGTGKQFEEVSTNAVTARMRLAEAQSAYDQVKNHRGQTLEQLQSIPAVLKDATVQQMKHADSDAARKITEYQGRYAAAHPKMIAAEAEQKSAREALGRAIEAVINGISREYEIARSNANAAAGAQAQTKAEIQNITRKEFQLGVLQREVDSNKQLYDTFVGRAKETEVSANLQSTAGRLVDPAVVSSSPLKPKKVQVISIAAILGLLAGVALVFLLDYLDSTLHTITDVERRLRVDVLGAVQILEQKAGQSIPAARAFADDSNSAFSESIRSIRTAVLLSSIDEPHRVVMVTSTLPGEGKTTISINLAFALGLVKKVLIIDGDIRRPSIGKSMGEGMDEGVGLVDYLAGEATIKECIRKTSSPNVFVLPAGKRFSSPLELLSSQKFGDSINKLKDLFDVVIIDCPPLKPVSDSLVISRYANAVIYVVKSDSTPHQLAGAAIKRLRGIDAPLLGIVLNQVDFKKADRYGHYSYGYKYQYAYGQEPAKQARSFMGIKI
jgi:capsular exopolysaccharide synthesis family protein